MYTLYGYPKTRSVRVAWAKGSKLDITLDGKTDNVSAYAQRVLGREAYERAWRKEMAHLPE